MLDTSDLHGSNSVVAQPPRIELLIRASCVDLMPVHRLSTRQFALHNRWEDPRGHFPRAGLDHFREPPCLATH